MTTRSLTMACLLALPLLPQPAGAQARTAEPGQAPVQAPIQAQASREAAPAARPFGSQGGSTTRIPKTLNEPLGLGSGQRQSAGQRNDLAPVPNRNIEAPPDRFANNGAATLEPMLLPPERRTGMTFGREHLRETGPDRPFDNVVPGARLRIPFEGNTR